MDFLLWKHFSEDKIIYLEETFEIEKLRSFFYKYFDLPSLTQEKKNVAIDFMLRNYAFCKERAFNTKKTSTFLSLFYEIFLKDMNLSSLENSMTTSYKNFQDLLLSHSVERPPKSIKVFDREDIEPILNFMMERYYKSFYLHRSVFGIETNPVFEQTSQIEVPYIPMPLSEADPISIIINEEKVAEA